MILVRRVSPRQQRVFIGLMLLLNTLLLFSPLSSIPKLLFIVACNAYGYYLWRDIAMLSARAVQQIKFDADGWWLLIDDEWVEVRLIDKALWRDVSMRLLFRSGWKMWRISLWCDSGEASALRRLRIRLIHGW